jgi:hypothetical protein
MSCIVGITNANTEYEVIKYTYTREVSMKKVSLLLLLLFTVYSSAALATSSDTRSWSETDWGNNEWNKPNWDHKEWGKDYTSYDPKHDVPEPGVVGLLAIGLLGMVVARRWLGHK